MAEIVEPGVLKTPKKRRAVKITDIIVFGVLFVIIALLAHTLISKLALKHEVSAAKPTAEKVVSDLAKQDTTALRLLGDTSFQAKNSAASLDAHLTATDPSGKPIKFSQLYGKTTPTLDKQIVANNTRGQHVVFVYKYSRLKAPLFVRVDTTKKPGASRWYLQAMTVSTDETGLTTLSQ